jgi:hypothetical protein
MSLSTSVKRAIKKMPTTDLEILANGMTPMTPMTDSSLSTSVKREIQAMPTTDLEILANGGHTNSTSSLERRSTTSLKRQVGLATSPHQGIFVKVFGKVFVKVFGKVQSRHVPWPMPSRPGIPHP